VHRRPIWRKFFYEKDKDGGAPYVPGNRGLRFGGSHASNGEDRVACFRLFSPVFLPSALFFLPRRDGPRRVVWTRPQRVGNDRYLCAP
jgi:hypothetical protein